jgi:hypothetical protein
MKATTVLLVALGVAACSTGNPRSDQPAFATPEEAVRALLDAARADDLDAVVAIFGSGKDLVDSSDPRLARRNRQVVLAAAAEQWRLVDDRTDRRVLVIGRESWPFPVPLVRGAAGWRFDTAAGREEILSRRIGRNELAAIRIARTYVVAQRLYARQGHDGKPPGRFARSFRSDPGRQNGLYWPAARRERRSPLGDLIANAADERARTAGADQSSPFHGYHFRILTAQGVAAPGGAKEYVVDDEMTAGFGLLAWPAEYDVTGIMTFVVSRDGVLHEKDLGPETKTLARTIALYNPDETWSAVP